MNKERYFSPGIINAGVDTVITVLDEAAALEEAGETLIYMDMGKPDIDAPERAKRAACKALDEGCSSYTDSRGILPLRKAIAAKEKRDNGLDYDYNREIMVTVGASEALMSVCSTFLDPGDEIIIPSPGYCSYFYLMTALEIKAVQIPVIKDCQVSVDVDAFESYITDKTKMMLINSPHNPTGLVYTREQIEKLAEIAKRHDLLVISDECYDKYFFEGEHISIATVPGMKERTLIINSVSKSYGMTGWRVGYIAGDRDFLDRINMFHGNLILCAPSFAQYGAAEAFNGEKKEEIDELRNKYKERRDYIVQTLDEIKELDYVYPKGAFYIMVDVHKTGLNGLEFALRLLRECHITSCPGEVYGDGFEGFIRLAYTCSTPEIKEAMRRLKAFVDSLR